MRNVFRTPSAIKKSKAGIACPPCCSFWFVGITHTAKHVKGYETAILAGAIFGNLLTVHQIRIPLGIFGLVLMGVLFGIFVGGWILALAEIVNIFPIFARRIGITKGYSLIVIAIAVGKTAGSLYHFYRRWGM